MIEEAVAEAAHKDMLGMVSAQLLVPDYVVRVALSVAHPRSTHWPAFRKAHLVKFPRCIACGGIEAPECHHVRPFHIDASLECDESNVVTLCEASGRWCHFRFGHLFNWKDWNPKVREDAAAFCGMLLHRRRQA